LLQQVALVPWLGPSYNIPTDNFAQVIEKVIEEFKKILPLFARR
jgi:hypothetical protein